MVYALTKFPKCGTWLGDHFRIGNGSFSVFTSPGSTQNAPASFLGVRVSRTVNTLVTRNGGGIVSLFASLLDMMSRTQKLTLANLFEEIRPRISVRDGKKLRHWINVVELQIFRRTTNHTTTSKKLSGFTHPSVIFLKLVRPLLFFTIHFSSFGRDSALSSYYSTR